jgi:predicted O-methyltransferase YrrM
MKIQNKELTWLSYELSKIINSYPIDCSIELVMNLLEKRGLEYLKNTDRYSELFIDPNSDISTKEAQIIQQVKFELLDFLKLVKTNNYKNVLQIGLGHFGSTHFCLSLLCDNVTTIDICKEFIDNYIEREKTYNKYKDSFIHGPSDDKLVIASAYINAPYDLLFIDANHNYEFVKKDYLNYIEMVKSGGICAFHDTILTTDQYGVSIFINELRLTKKIKDIIHSKTTGISYFIKD